MPILGSTSDNGGIMSFPSTTRAMVLLLSGAGRTLESVTLIKPGGAGRVSVYAGGTEADPSGATLLGSALFPSSGTATEPETIAFSPTFSLPASGYLWLAVQTGGNFAPVTSDVSGKGDWLTPRYESSAIPGDLGTAMPGTWPADSGSVGSTYLYAQLTYSVSGGGNTSPTVVIDQGATASVEEGATLQLTATVADAEDDPDPAPSWSSDTPAVATVSGGGLVTGVAEGTAVVTATVTDEDAATASDSITITVTGAVGGTVDVEYEVLAIVVTSRSARSNKRTVSV